MADHEPTRQPRYENVITIVLPDLPEDEYDRVTDAIFEAMSPPDRQGWDGLMSGTRQECTPDGE